MNTIDYLLIAAVIAAAGYTVYRLFVGWLRTRSSDFEQDGSDESGWPLR